MLHSKGEYKQQPPSTEEELEPLLLNVILVGPKDSGKTCMFNRFTCGEFKETAPKSKIHLDTHQDISFVLRDTGDETFGLPEDEKSIDTTDFYCKDAKSLIYVFDGEKLTEDQIDTAAKFLQTNLSKTANANVHFVINKSDLIEEAKATEKLESFKQTLIKKMSALPAFRKKEIDVVACSAKTGKGFQNLVKNVIKAALKQNIAELKKQLLVQNFANATERVRIAYQTTLRNKEALFSQKKTELDEIKKHLQGKNSRLFQPRNTQKIFYCEKLYADLEGAIKEGNAAKTTIEERCRFVMSEYTATVEQQKLILAGRRKHRIVDFLNSVNPKIVEDIRESIKAGKPYRYVAGR